MRKCTVCGGAAHVSTIPVHVEDLVGMRVAIVNSAQKIGCAACGEESITIPDVPGLIAAAAVARIMMPVKLNGSEIRFLRKAIELQAKDLARILSVRPETLSRWENDKEPIQVTPEKLLRVLVGTTIKGEPDDKAPAMEFNAAAVIDMAIKPVRPSDGRPLVVLGLVNARLAQRRKLVPVWNEAESEAA